jgi:7,8-dihydropterin-6-yl-methyl-4-(beta-D-ribofuranosyl)aminobenzene 5'-phosphate synthase
MKATLLLENHSLFCKYYNAEHGFSAWVEDADYVVISHGHYDHCGALKYLLKYYRDRGIARKPILLMAHPDIMLKKYEFNWDQNIGMDVDMEYLNQYFHVQFQSEPLWLTKNLVFMGITEISNNFERSFPQTAKKLKDGEWVDDYVIEDTQLAYRHKNGEEATVIATCAHYGICNIMEYAKKLTGAKRIHTYLGGSHLRSIEVPQKQMDKTCEYLRGANIEDFYICHDTDLPCLLQLAQAAPAREAGVGLVVERN